VKKTLGFILENTIPTEIEKENLVRIFLTQRLLTTATLLKEIPPEATI
jgi:hypothetical protein